MQGFTSYLEEKWKVLRSARDRHAFEVNNKRSLGGREVEVSFMRRYDMGAPIPGKFSILFTVSGYYSKEEELESKLATQILAHVLHRIDQFIRKVKPIELDFSSNVGPKIIMYEKLAKHLANRYRGTWTKSGLGTVAYRITLPVQARRPQGL